MKKLFSLLAMAAMVFTACQNDEGVKNPTLADEGIVNLSVGVPELATRALDGDGQFGFDSAYGAIDYAKYTSFLETEYDVRFQLAVYEAGAAEDAEPVYTATNYVDFASTTDFNDLRFVPGREYQFVLFADFVEQGSQDDFRYNTADLRNITAFEPLNAMDETYDAYFFNETIKIEAGKVNEFEAVLKRPFGKIRVLTTDLAWVENYAAPAEGEVTFYNHAIYKSFNALTGEVTTEATNAEETHRYAIDPAYYAGTMYNNDEAFTLFTTYVLATNAQEAVNFRLDTFEEDGSLIKSLDFNTEIPYQRNHLTTLVGNLLTNEADLTIRIDDNFDAEEFIGGDFENVENGLKWVREGELVGGQVYKYETNLFSFRLLSETDGTDLREGRYDYTEELPYIQNATGFDIQGIDVEKGSLEIIKRGTRAGNFYDVVFDIYATIDGKTENYILTWNGELKGAREPLAEPVVSYEVDEVELLDITFSWEAVENAANYTVKWNEEEQTVEGTSATFDFSGKDTYATASVTANPANADDYTASTGYVTVDWKAPIFYQEVEVFLQYVKDNEVAFYNETYTIYFENYPSFEGAWYQTKGETPVPFSAEADLVETVGSAAQVAIYEPTIATCFLYKGAMNPYILTEAEVNWLAGYNTVKVLFSNEDGDAIEFQTTAPMEAGHATIEPTYVAIGGDQAANIENAEMNVLLKNGEYTIFFTIHSATNDVLMQYVGAIDFEKPYAPEYVLTSYEARENTIYFKGEGVEYEIEATSLESGDVVVKYIAIQGSPMDITAATAVVKEKENGDYDARYTLPLDYTNPFTGKDTFDLQYVGPFKAYEAPAEPEQVTEFKATYEDVEGLAVFTGIEYDYKIFVNKLATVEYDGTQADGWGARSLKFPAGEDFYRFNHGDKLTVDGNNVTLEFVGWNGSKMRMVASTAPAAQEPEDITVQLALENGLYVGGNYKIEYNQGAAVVHVQNVAAPGNMIDLGVTVYDDADELVFEFFDNFNNANVTAIYTKNVVDPAGNVKVTLTLEGEIYKGLYETTIYSLFGLDYGKAMLQIDYADGTSAKGLNADYTEDEQFITFKFFDEKNYVNVTALYQKVTAPVAPVFDYNFDTITLNSNAEQGVSFRVKDNAGNYVDFVVNTADATAKSIKAAEYTFGMDYPYDNAGKFTFSKAGLESGTWYKSYNQFVGGSLKVSLNDKVYTIEMSISLSTGATETARFEGIGVLTGEEQPVTPPTQDWTDLSETAKLGDVAGFPAYVSDNYHIIGETWTERANDKNYGTCEIVETANGYIFTFDDKKNFRHVTITYTEESTDDTVVYDPWACTASNVSGNPGTGYSVTLTGDNGDVIVLTGVKFNVWGASSATLNDNAVEFTGNGAMIDTNNGGYIKVDITIGNTTYKGTSKNSIA